MKVVRRAERGTEFKSIAVFVSGTLVEDRKGTVYLLATRDLDYLLPLKAGEGRVPVIPDRFTLAPANEMYRKFEGVLELENE